ncbi:MAG: dihydrolipoamide acetyltransferase family protein [Woeseiaceae bacterium]|jgi:2-oxoisovalerate dehydrogenase E2 component (dihydrolipoyl transacylase)|nr:dihydrolipoamide acetyltransferase family protein [Woeseiaceae bacterium]
MSEYVFKLPDLGEGTVESEIGEWFIKLGDQVEEEQVVGTMMTDKAAVELSSPVSGRVVKLAGEPGDIVAVGAPLVIFETDAAAAAASEAGDDNADEAAEPPAKPEAPATQPAATPVETPQRADGSRRIITSPAIRRRAKEAGIDLVDVPGTGPNGRITRMDFDAFVEASGTETPAATPARRSKRVTEIKVIGLRRMIAERMTAAKREIPHFAYVEELDITELESLRKHLNEKNPDDKLTILPFLGVALVRALRDFPQCNATYDRDRNLILQHEAVHLGVATQTPDGLKVPVVHHAESMGLRELAREIRQVSEAARDNRATKSQLSGSTITITSLGKLGGIASTPVINMPEVGIIGVNRAVERPAVVNGQITVRTIMNLSSSFDHRFVDGYDAAAMIQRIREMLEHPATLFID